MKTIDLIQRALQRQTEMTTIAALEKRIQVLEATLSKLTVPKTTGPTKEEEAFMKMTEPERMAWAKKAAASIAYITNIDVCSKCNRTVSTEVPTGKITYTVTCPLCRHSETKSYF